MISTQIAHNDFPDTTIITADHRHDRQKFDPSSSTLGYLPLNLTSGRNTSTSFEDLLASTSLPPPGPSYYVARRALWLADSHLPLPTSEPSTSRQRLEYLLSQPGGTENEAVWKGGVEKVWKGLVAGGRLKRRLPMRLVVRIQSDPKLIVTIL